MVLNMEKIELLKIVKNIVTKNIIFNIFLAVIKIIIGIFSNSFSLITNGFYTFSNVFLSISALNNTILIKQDTLESEMEKRKTGHMLIITFSFILFMISLFTTLISFFNITKTVGYYNDTPQLWAVPVIAVTIIIKLFMCMTQKEKADETKSIPILSIYSDYKLDIILSVFTIIGIIGCYILDYYVESIVSIGISIMLAVTSVRIIKTMFAQMVDTEAQPEITEQINGLVTTVDGVLSISKSQIRQYSEKIYCDVEINVSNELSMKKCKYISEKVRTLLENNIPNLKSCNVHLN